MINFINLTIYCILRISIYSITFPLFLLLKNYPVFIKKPGHMIEMLLIIGTIICILFIIVLNIRDPIYWIDNKSILNEIYAKKEVVKFEGNMIREKFQNMRKTVNRGLHIRGYGNQMTDSLELTLEPFSEKLANNSNAIQQRKGKPVDTLLYLDKANGLPDARSMNDHVIPGDITPPFDCHGDGHMTIQNTKIKEYTKSAFILARPLAGNNTLPDNIYSLIKKSKTDMSIDYEKLIQEHHIALERVNMFYSLIFVLLIRITFLIILLFFSNKLKNLLPKNLNLLGKILFPYGIVALLILNRAYLFFNLVYLANCIEFLTSNPLHKDLGTLLNLLHTMYRNG